MPLVLTNSLTRQTDIFVLAAWFEQPTGEDGDTAWIQRMVEARLAVRSARDYATVDRIRDELAALGITAEDRADGSARQRAG